MLFLGKDPGGAVSLIAKPRLPTASWSYENRAEIYSAEFQQIWKRERHGVIGGARRRAFAALRAKIGKGLSAAFMQSQDGWTEFQGGKQ